MINAIILMLLVVSLITIFPCISVMVRRLRDIGFTNLGIIIVIALAIFSGMFLSFILALLPSNALVTNSEKNLLTKLIRNDK